MKPDPMMKMLFRSAKRRRVVADRGDMAEMLYQPNEFTTELPAQTWRKFYQGVEIESSNDVVLQSEGHGMCVTGASSWHLTPHGIEIKNYPDRTVGK